MSKIKICGITKIIETQYLNEAGVDYAGFVFHEKSKRNISEETAYELIEALDENIKKVAVMVSPDPEKIERLGKLPFDIMQIHGTLTDAVIEACDRPIWYAVNVSDVASTEAVVSRMESMRTDHASKIAGFLLDAPVYGSGHTFDWDKGRNEQCLILDRRWRRDRLLVLAGGLNPENVAEGMEIFAPDVVDVSSSVEGTYGKDREKILSFVQAVRATERINGGRE